MFMKDEKFITTPELAKMLGVSRIAVYKRIKSGKIKALRIGRNFVIDKKDLGDILGKELKQSEKLEIEKAVEKTVADYGETLKMLGKT
ncbi:MAG: helix-turn-helix domain-containing protein [Patescibacteria group bacterium]